jgi:transposase
MKAYSQDLRDRVIIAYKKGMLTRTQISQLFNICYLTACNWIKRYEKTGEYSSKQGVGCGREIRFSDREKILNYLEKNPDADGIDMRDALAADIPMSTWYDTLSRLEITYKKKSQNTNREMRRGVNILQNKSLK